MPSQSRISAVESVERRLLDAQLQGDRGALDKLLADNYVGTNPDGSRVNKSQEIENLLRSGYSSGELLNMAVEVHENTAIAVGQLVLRKGTLSHRYSFTDVYVGDQLVACQAVLA